MIGWLDKSGHGKGYGYPASVAFSPQGSILAVGTEHDSEVGATGPNGDPVLLFDIGTGRLRHIVGNMYSGRYLPIFSPDGRTFAMWNGARIFLCDPRTGRTRRTIKQYNDRNASVAFFPDGRVLITGGEHIRAYSLRTGQMLWTTGQNIQNAEAVSIAISPDGKIVAYAGSLSSLSLCDARTGKTLRTLPVPYDGTRSIAFSPDGQWLAVGCRDGVELWPMKQIRKKLALRAFQRQTRAPRGPCPV